MSQSNEEMVKQDPTFFELWMFNLSNMWNEADEVGHLICIALVMFAIAILFALPVIGMGFFPFGVASAIVAGLGLLVLLSALMISLANTYAYKESLIVAKQKADETVDMSDADETSEESQSWFILQIIVSIYDSISNLISDYVSSEKTGYQLS